MHRETSKPLLDSSSRDCQSVKQWICFFTRAKPTRATSSTCAIYGSGKALELLLHFMLFFKFLKVNKSFIDMDTLLHQKNDYGNTLLSLTYPPVQRWPSRTQDNPPWDGKGVSLERWKGKQADVLFPQQPGGVERSSWSNQECGKDPGKRQSCYFRYLD